MVRASASLSSDETSKSAFVDRQAGFVEQVAERVRSRAEAQNVSYSMVLKAAGGSSSAVANYWTGKRPWPVEQLSTVADLLSTSVDRLLGKERSGDLIDANDADWVELPEYALTEFSERGRMEPIATALVRRDWLHSSLGESSGLWIGRLPAPYDALALHRGEPIICTDYRRGEKLQDGIHYLFWVNGGIVMAPFARREDNAPDRAVFVRNIGIEEDQYQPVARVVGVLARPI